MSSKDWEVGSVLKDKAGSQGTLFRGGTKFSSDARYPRGYTPERQAEVRAAIKPSTGVTSDDPVDQAHQLRRIGDTVARSTVPTEHLNGVQWMHGRPGEEVVIGGGAAGAYYPAKDTHPESIARSRGVEVSAPKIGVKSEYDRTGTVIHEIGHHVSHTVDQTEHSKPGNYSYESAHGGAEEAFADEYAEKHYRDRKGRPEAREVYGGGRYAGHLTRSDEFWDSYSKHRTWGMSKAETDAGNEKYYKKYPEEKPHPDGSYDMPLLDKPYTSEGEKATTSINPDAVPVDRLQDYYRDH